MSAITAPFDAISSAANGLAAAMSAIDKDETAVQTAQSALADATATLTTAQSTLDSDQRGGQAAADAVVAAIATAGFQINVPSPVSPPPSANTGS